MPYPTEVALALALAPLRDPTASKLDIRGLEFGAEGVEKIAEALQHEDCRVTHLHLGSNKIGAAGAYLLVRALQHENCRVTNLQLSGNKIGDEGVEYLARALHHENCRVTDLDLTTNNISDASVEYLVRALQHENCRVTNFNLEGNSIGAEGMKLLVHALQHINCRVTHLNLSCNAIRNEIGDEGVEHLSRALQHENCRVTHLDLCFNKIGDEGVEHLAHALQHENCRVTNLDLGQNYNIGVGGVTHLVRALQHENCRVADLNLYGIINFRTPLSGNQIDKLVLDRLKTFHDTNVKKALDEQRRLLRQQNVVEDEQRRLLRQQNMVEDLRTPDRLGRTPMYRACRDGDLERVKYLVENGAKDDIRRRNPGPSQKGWTPMLIGCFGGHLPIVRFLFEHGAKEEVTRPTKDGHTLMSISCKRLSLSGVRNSSAKFFSSKAEDLDVVQWLIEQGTPSKNVTSWFSHFNDAHRAILFQRALENRDVHHESFLALVYILRKVDATPYLSRDDKGCQRTRDAHVLKLRRFLTDGVVVRSISEFLQGRSNTRSLWYFIVRSEEQMRHAKAQNRFAGAQARIAEVRERFINNEEEEKQFFIVKGVLYYFEEEEKQYAEEEKRYADEQKRFAQEQKKYSKCKM